MSCGGGALIRTKEYVIPRSAVLKISFLGAGRPLISFFVLVIALLSVLLLPLFGIVGEKAKAGDLVELTLLFLFLLGILFWKRWTANTYLIHRKHFLEIGDGFIALHSENGNLTKFKIEDLVKVIKRYGCLFLFTTPTIAFPVPVDAFSSSQDFENFKSLLKQSLPEKKIKF